MIYYIVYYNKIIFKACQKMMKAIHLKKFPICQYFLPLSIVSDFNTSVKLLAFASTFHSTPPLPPGGLGLPSPSRLKE